MSELLWMVGGLALWVALLYGLARAQRWAEGPAPDLGPLPESCHHVRNVRKLRQVDYPIAPLPPEYGN